MAEDLERLKRVAEADVYKQGRRAGTLARSAHGIAFRYLPDYDGPPVATSLPVSGAVRRAPAGAVPAFFSGLLPEGRRLAAIRRAVKTSADDELTLLLVVGADAIGDVQIVPAGESPDLPEPAFERPDFEDVRFADLLADAFAGRRDLAGLPGVQDKVSGRVISGPVRGRSKSYILKLDPPDFPHLVQNEAFFLAAARASGMAVAEAVVVEDRDGRKGLLVTRFDRYREKSGALRMRAQEDACQVLGRYPADKYALSAEVATTALADLCRARPVACRDLFRLLAFAYLTGNGDSHGKNLSVVRMEDEWRVTPAYDVPSTHPYGDVSMAITINGKSREDITRRDFLTLSDRLSLPERAASSVLDSLASAVDEWIDGVADLPFGRRRNHKLRRLILDRAAKLA